MMPPRRIQPTDLVDRYEQARARTRMLFALLEPAAFAARPIPLRHPIRFYEGHIAAFYANQLFQAALLTALPAPELSHLFERGIDPEDLGQARGVAIHEWPERARVADYVDDVHARVLQVMRTGSKPEILHTCLEHEEMHQETLVYLIHQLPADMKRKPDDWPLARPETGVDKSWREIPAGVALLGADPHALPFGWDNEFPRHAASVNAFAMESHKVTNAEFLAFLQDGGYQNRTFWLPKAWSYLQESGHAAPSFWRQLGGRWAYRGLFDTIALPQSWPALVTYWEADAYARWKGCRLPTEAEFQRAAHPIDGEDSGGDAAPAETWTWEFESVGRAEVTNPWGVAGLVGNGWEWTSTPFMGFSGFQPMPHYAGYSADFFDGRHFVLKGASPVTPRALVRPSFRNWYRDNYCYAYTTFRCVRELNHD